MDVLIEDFDLSDDRAIPDWILDVLDAWSSDRVTDDWVQFEWGGQGASDALEFLINLPRWLPIAIDNQGERWTLTSPQLSSEAIIAFEGYFYLVKPVGTPEPGVEPRFP